MSDKWWIEDPTLHSSTQASDSEGTSHPKNHQPVEKLGQTLVIISTQQSHKRVVTPEPINTDPF